MNRNARRIVATAAIVGAGIAATAGIAAAEPPEEVFTEKDQVWFCHDDGFPAPSHCLNGRSNGKTGVLLVFPPDDRGPAEGISHDPAVDSRPCPHDPGSPDGTWWEVVPNTWVCHHKP